MDYEEAQRSIDDFRHEVALQEQRKGTTLHARHNSPGKTTRWWLWRRVSICLRMCGLRGLL